MTMPMSMTSEATKKERERERKKERERERERGLNDCELFEKTSEHCWLLSGQRRYGRLSQFDLWRKAFLWTLLWQATCNSLFAMIAPCNTRHLCPSSTTLIAIHRAARDFFLVGHYINVAKQQYLFMRLMYIYFSLITVNRHPAAVLYIRQRSTVSKCSDGVADYVHVPAGSVKSLIPLFFFDSPCAICSEEINTSRLRHDICIGFDFDYWTVRDTFRPHGGPKGSFLVLYFVFLRYAAGCLLNKIFWQ